MANNEKKTPAQRQHELLEERDNLNRLRLTLESRNAAKSDRDALVQVRKRLAEIDYELAQIGPLS